jgi:hypothetical protein
MDLHDFGGFRYGTLLYPIHHFYLVELKNDTEKYMKQGNEKKGENMNEKGRKSI